MANKSNEGGKSRKAEGNRGGDHPPRWQGEAVEGKPGDEAERAADRAEGSAPVRADEESLRSHHPSLAEQPQLPKRQDLGDDEEDTEAAAEEHSARRDAGERSPRGKL